MTRSAFFIILFFCLLIFNFLKINQICFKEIFWIILVEMEYILQGIKIRADKGS